MSRVYDNWEKLSMSRVYDNWEKLVVATLDKVKLHQLALADSMEFSSRSSCSSSSNSIYNFRLNVESNSPDYVATTGRARDIPVPIHLTHLVIKGADAATSFKQKCMDVKHKIQQLELLLQQVAESANDIIYDRPVRRIMDDTHEVVNQALVLVTKCRVNLRWRLFTKITAAAFRTVLSHLQSSIGNVSWILQVDKFIKGGIPPIAYTDLNLFHLWERITMLHKGSPEKLCNVAVSLICIPSNDNPFFKKLFIEEGGVLPLLRLLKESTMELQENAARALLWLLKDPDSIRDVRDSEIMDLFRRMLKEGPMRVQAAVALAISEISGFRNIHFFLEDKIIEVQNVSTNHAGVSYFSTNSEIGEAKGKEDRTLKVYIYPMVAKVLQNLVSLRTVTISKNIMDSDIIFHLAILLDKVPKELRYSIIMVLMEITELAHKYALPESYFKPNKNVCKAIVDLLLGVIEMEDSELLIPCIKIVRILAQYFGAASEIRTIICPIVKLLHNQQTYEVRMEACITLVRFVSYKKFFSLVYCKEIIIANGANYLVQLVSHFEDIIVQIQALILLCYLVRRVPQSKELSDTLVLDTLEMALEHEPYKKNKELEFLLPLAAKNLVLPRQSNGEKRQLS